MMKRSTNYIRLLCTLSVCLSMITMPTQALPQDVLCTFLPTDPTTCYITTPIFLLPTNTLNIVKTPEMVNVTRFELRAATNLIRIPPIIWSVFPNLEEVIMANLASVNALSGMDLLYASKLKVLNLRGNKLTTLPLSTFAYTPALQYLDLSSNLITEIEAMAFQGATNLTVLDLSFNRLGMLDFFTFEGLTNLQAIDLRENKIKLIGAGTFSSPKLRILNMNTNDLKLLPDLLFGALTSPPLEYVDFGDNKLAQIGSALYDLQELKVLNLTSNKKIIDINLAQLAQLPKLEKLLLSASGFQFPLVSATIASPPVSASLPVPISDSPLKELYLAKNKLMNPDVFRQLAYFRNLETLSLQSNRFAILYDIESLNEWFPNLKTVFLGDNKLDCTWLNATLPLIQATGIDFYTIQKTKSVVGTALWSQKLIDADDCFDLGKIFDKVLFFINKFSTPVGV